MRIYLVRHAETDCSAARRICGEVDAPLNVRGVAMAECLAIAYDKRPIVAIYSSPQRRAVDTAVPLARRLGLTVAQDTDWRELGFGAWDTLTQDEAAARDPERFAAWLEDPVATTPPGGESALAVAQRVSQAFERIRSHSTGDCMIVAHKGSLRLLLCSLLGIDLRLFRHRLGQQPAGVSCLEWRTHGPLLHTLSDTSHLPEELRSHLGS
ncbi:MAG: histidine phosphatase family protein [Myxococcota bacterium]